MCGAARSTAEAERADRGPEGWDGAAGAAGGAVGGEAAHREGPGPPTATLPQQRQHCPAVPPEQEGNTIKLGFFNSKFK